MSLFAVRRRAAAAAAASALAALVAVTGAQPARAATGSADAGKKPESFRISDPRITESSGLAASRRHKGVYWTHNDSDDGPYVYAVDSATGKTVATVTLRGIQPRDVEAISIGPGGSIHVGDIGDNFGGRWTEVWIYRFDEPAKLQDVTVTPTRYTVQYDDGPRDAESLMVHPKTGRAYIASKSSKKNGGIYEGPAQLSPSGVNVFRRIARTEVTATDGAFSPDGTRLVLRSYFGGEMFKWRDGKPRPVDRPVNPPLTGQGESITFTPDGRTLMCGAEGRNSLVAPLELDGELLPDSVTEREESPDGRRGGDGAAGDGDGPADRNVIGGGLTVVVLVGLWILLRGGSRRRG